MTDHAPASPRQVAPRSGPGAARRLSRLLLAPLLLAGGVAACAPQNTGSTYGAGSLGRAASISYGTIKGLRPVVVQGGAGGLGTATGAVAGGVAGSFIGGDVRSNIIAGLGGALLGGLAGNAIERGATTGNAVEFFVGEDYGGDISVVQTNEDTLQVGDRVVISRGDRVRLSRAAGGPPPLAGYAPSGGGYGASAGAAVSPGAAIGAPGAYGGAPGAYTSSVGGAVRK